MKVKNFNIRRALISGVSPAEVFFHMFYADADGDPAAIVEDCKTHQVIICHAGNVTFLDAPTFVIEEDEE